jgi:hypothetical protein
MLTRESLKWYVKKKNNGVTEYGGKEEDAGTSLSSYQRPMTLSLLV